MSSRLVELAASIADGRPVDWEAAEREVPADDRGRLGALRGVARLVEAQGGSAPAGAQGAPGVGRGAGADPGAAPGIVACADADLAADAEVRAGAGTDGTPERWCGLRIRVPIGQGAYGRVFAAFDPRLDREVALKLIPAAVTAGDGADAVVEEGRLLARVKHANVVTVYGAEQADGFVGLWMERIRGRTLADLIHEDGPIDAGHAALLGADLCAALAAVHAAGVVHRDIKARNVMREAGGRVLLMDFGVGVERGAARGSVVGTPAYMAPEVLSGQLATRRSDLYAVGVLLFFLVTGEVPVQGATVDEIRGNIEAGRTRRVRDLRPELPSGFVDIVDRLLAGDPSRRYRTAGEVETALRRVLAGPARQRRRWLGGAAAALAVVAGAGYWLAGLGGELPTPPTPARQWYEHALDERAAGRLREAQDLLEMAVEAEPAFYLAWSELADVAAGQGRYVEAFDAAARACQARDSLPVPESYRAGATCLLAQLRYDEARGEMRKLLRLEPGNVRMLSRIGQTLGLAEGRVDEGLAYSRRAVAAIDAGQSTELEPGADIIARGMVVLLLALGDLPDQAEAELAQVRARLAADGQPTDHPYLRWGEGMIALMRGDDVAAAERFGGMIAAAPEYGPEYAVFGRYLTAQAHILGGRYRRAEAILGEGLPADVSGNYQATDAKSETWLAWLAFRRGDRERALARLGHVELLDDIPTNLRYLRAAGVFFAEFGAPDRAAGILARVRAIGGRWPSAIAQGASDHLEGVLAASRGDWTLARYHYDRAGRTLRDPSLLWSSYRAADAVGGCAAAHDDLRALDANRGWLFNRYAGAIWIDARARTQECGLGPELAAATNPIRN